MGVPLENTKNHTLGGTGGHLPFTLRHTLSWDQDRLVSWIPIPIPRRSPEPRYSGEETEDYTKPFPVTCRVSLGAMDKRGGAEEKRDAEGRKRKGEVKNKRGQMGGRRGEGERKERNKGERTKEEERGRRGEEE